MKYSIENTKDLEPMFFDTAQFGQESDATLVQYFKDFDFLLNRSYKVILGKYDYTKYKEEPQRFTKTKVSRFGIKNLLGIGAYGYYMDEEGLIGTIKVPINYTEGKVPPSLSTTDQDTTIKYSINNPDLFSYEAFRLVFLQGDFAYEFITYELEGEAEKPFGMFGDFEVSCIGYRNELQDFSVPSESINISIVQRSDDVKEPNILSLTLELDYGEWEENNTQYILAQGVTQTNTVIVGPHPSSINLYAEAGVVCVDQDDNMLKFECSETPEENILVNVVVIL